MPGIETDAVLHVSEGVQLSVDEAEFAMEAWLAFPEQLVGFVGHTHFWEEEGLRWVYSSGPSNEYSVVLSGAVLLHRSVGSPSHTLTPSHPHRYYSHVLTHSLPHTLARIATTEQGCANLILNFYISHITQQPPIKATHRQTLGPGGKTAVDMETKQFDQSQVPCLNMLVTAFGYMPLRLSSVRFDPVLFKDSVSMFRKQYRNLDVLDGS